NRSATRAIAPCCCPDSSRIPNTIRTARSRTSSGYFFGAGMTPTLARLGASNEPGAAHSETWPPASRGRATTGAGGNRGHGPVRPLAVAWVAVDRPVPRQACCSHLLGIDSHCQVTSYRLGCRVGRPGLVAMTTSHPPPATERLAHVQIGG